MSTPTAEPPRPGELHRRSPDDLLAFACALRDPATRRELDARDGAEHERLMADDPARRLDHADRADAAADRLRRVIRRRSRALRASAPCGARHVLGTWGRPAGRSADRGAGARRRPAARSRRRRHVARATTSADPGDDDTPRPAAAGAEVRA
jgi:hypothetical protein